jgi:hypothetical protein
MLLSKYGRNGILSRLENMGTMNSHLVDKPEVSMKKALVVVLMIIVVLSIAGCAPGPNSFINTNSDKGYVPGFWYGLWNGATSPVTFIISLFNSKVQMYEVHNNGGWYNFGFILGISVAFGGSAGGAARRRRNR